MEGGAVGHNFERDPPKDHPCQVWLIWFRGFRGEDLNVKVYDVQTDGRRRTPSDSKSSHGLWPGELTSVFSRRKLFTIKHLAKLTIKFYHMIQQ